MSLENTPKITGPYAAEARPRRRVSGWGSGGNAIQLKNPHETQKVGSFEDSNPANRQNHQKVLTANNCLQNTIKWTKK